MSEIIEVSLERKKCYEIIINDSYDILSEKIKELYGDEVRKACIITDSNVGPLYAEIIKENVKNNFSSVHIYSFEAGEENKKLSTVEAAYEYLIENKFNRKDVILALGGGVCGDMSGFIAATYLRGIDFIQLPTSLLSMVDSSIGGKTGVDLNLYKNMVGAFKMPRLVYINTSVLNSLPDRQYASGMAEVLKAGLIKDGNFYEWLINNFVEINDKDPEALNELLTKSINIKRLVVEKDPYEQGDRALLNLGHTLGHAIEKEYDFKFYHGECVALGTIAAAYISWKKNLLSMEEYYEIRDMFVPFDLPICVEKIDAEKIVELTKSDKKNDGLGIKFILLKKIGKGIISRDVTRDEMIEAVKSLNFDIDE